VANKIIKNLQALRGIAVLSVLSLHLYGAERLFDTGGTVLPDFCNFGAFGVDLFFVISGFIMVTVTRGKFSGLRSSCKFLLSRFFRIFPLYWIYSAAFLFALEFFGFGDSGRLQHISIWRSFLLFPQDQYPVLVVGWTLIYEVYFYVVFGALMVFSEHSFIRLLLGWGAAIIAVGLSAHLFSLSFGPLLKLVFGPLTLAFIAGGLLALFMRDRTCRYGGLFLIAAAVFLSAVYMLSGYERYPAGWMRVMLFGIPAVMILYGAVSLELNNSVFFPAVLGFIGDISYSVYLAHVPIILLVFSLWSRFIATGTLVSLPPIIISCLLVFIVSVISYYAVEKPVDKFKHRILRNL